ncbi:unnamed protein product [Effrenium voratum]|uniref:Uncharacterized protein n=1 Tax=Effrenium voratum TaxID=2562239 RepID=A0AA36IGP7_9DINO|nr:unnamed protein product [Effrenium voratum]
MLALALQGHAPKALSALSAHDAFGRPKAGRSGSLPTLRTGRRKPRAASSAAAALVLAQALEAPGPVLFRLRLTCPEELELPEVAVSLAEGEVKESSPQRSPGCMEVTYTLQTPPNAQPQGLLRLGGSWAPICFAVPHGRSAAYVGHPGRTRYTALLTDSWDWRSAPKPSEGWAADLELGRGQLNLQLRRATQAEVKRCCQQQALREALEGSYDELFAQVTKARQQAVELEHLEKAEEKLKAMRKQRLHVAPNCSKEELRQLMAWARVTRTPEPAPQASLCPTAGCPCNQSLDGEVLSIQHDALSDFGPEADKEMFEMLVEAAISSEEGAVWPAGGKLIFSAFDRNQSVNALVRTLETAGQRRCAEMLLALAKAAGESAGGFVSAAQVNFHVDGSSFHDQHRDVYSAKQRAGPNCACSFRECVGTLCYSLGSSRLCRLRSMVDDLSFLRPCGETCRGYQEDRWLHSGDAMFFNALWNQNHTHGIPKMPGAGPRISVAFLLGAS